jgi:hypothetical protein
LLRWCWLSSIMYMSDRSYGLEVKAGKNAARTANELLEAGKLDYIYNLKDTYGARDGKKLAVPNYLAGRISFSLGA